MSDEKIDSVSDVKTNETKNLDPEIQARDVRWRAQAKILAEENEAFKMSTAKEKADLLSKIDSSTKAQQELQKKVLEAEIKAHAVAAGIKDIDFIKMIDTKGLVIKEDGSIEGIEKAVEDLKISKPILFGAEKKYSSSKNEKMPSDEKETKINAFTMTDAEFAAQKAKLGLY